MLVSVCLEDGIWSLQIDPFKRWASANVDVEECIVSGWRRVVDVWFVCYLSNQLPHLNALWRSAVWICIQLGKPRSETNLEPWVLTAERCDAMIGLRGASRKRDSDHGIASLCTSPGVSGSRRYWSSLLASTYHLVVRGFKIIWVWGAGFGGSRLSLWWADLKHSGCFGLTSSSRSVWLWPRGWFDFSVRLITFGCFQLLAWLAWNLLGFKLAGFGLKPWGYCTWLGLPVLTWLSGFLFRLMVRHVAPLKMSTVLLYTQSALCSWRLVLVRTSWLETRWWHWPVASLWTRS